MGPLLALSWYSMEHTSTIGINSCSLLDAKATVFLATVESIKMKFKGKCVWHPKF